LKVTKYIPLQSLSIGRIQENDIEGLFALQHPKRSQSVHKKYPRPVIELRKDQIVADAVVSLPVIFRKGREIRTPA